MNFKEKNIDRSGYILCPECKEGKFTFQDMPKDRIYFDSCPVCHQMMSVGFDDYMPFVKQMGEGIPVPESKKCEETPTRKVEFFGGYKWATCGCDCLKPCDCPCHKEEKPECCIGFKLDGVLFHECKDHKPYCAKEYDCGCLRGADEKQFRKELMNFMYVYCAATGNESVKFVEALESLKKKFL